MITVAAATAAVLAVLAWWLTWLTSRLDRLAERCQASWAALDAQLVRRAAAAAAYAVQVADAGLAAAAAAALDPPEGGREEVENALSRALRHAPPGGPATEGAIEALRVATARVVLARQFHNDAVRDWRALRTRPVVRALGLARRRSAHAFFDIDDRALPGAHAVESQVTVGPAAAAPPEPTE